jgi:hypothetical protein
LQLLIGFSTEDLLVLYARGPIPEIKANGELVNKRRLFSQYEMKE